MVWSVVHMGISGRVGGGKVRKGDLIWGWLTEQIGVVVQVGEHAYGGRGAIKVLWTTQGDSLFPPGGVEWTDPRSVELLEAKK